MRLRLGCPRVALIVAPHADDETIGAFGLIRALRGAGTIVRVIVVTDGAASHPSSRLWPRDRLVRAREGETRRAMRRMGVARSAICFLRMPDGHLPLDAAACRQRLGAAVRRAGKLDMIVGPDRDDDHADHRQVAATLAALHLPGVRRLRFKVWPTGSRARRAASLILPPQLRDAKRLALRSYRTQCGLIRDDPRGFAMSHRQIAAFTRQQELFMEGRR